MTDNWESKQDNKKQCLNIQVMKEGVIIIKWDTQMLEKIDCD